jgi:hypothetical protein
MIQKRHLCLHVKERTTEQRAQRGELDTRRKTPEANEELSWIVKVSRIERASHEKIDILIGPEHESSKRMAEALGTQSLVRSMAVTDGIERHQGEEGVEDKLKMSQGKSNFSRPLPGQSAL